MGIVVMLVLVRSHMSVSLTFFSLSHTHTSWRLKKRSIEHMQADELLICLAVACQCITGHDVHYSDHASYYMYYSTYYIVLHHTSTTSILLTGKWRELSLYICSYDVMMQVRWSSRLSNNSFPNPATP
jgi:hypothetical protein